MLGKAKPSVAVRRRAAAIRWCRGWADPPGGVADVVLPSRARRVMSGRFAYLDVKQAGYDPFPLPS